MEYLLTLPAGRRSHSNQRGVHTARRDLLRRDVISALSRTVPDWAG